MLSAHSFHLYLGHDQFSTVLKKAIFQVSNGASLRQYKHLRGWGKVISKV